MPEQQRDIDTGPIDGIRFLLALWVAAGHFYNLIGGARFRPIPLGGILAANGVAVDGFMVISGFLMTYNYCRREAVEPWDEARTVWRFLARRWTRLWPVYALACGAAFLLQTARQDEALAVLRFFTGGDLEPWGQKRLLAFGGWSDLASHLSFLHGFVPGQVETILGPAWSLALEMQFYAAFPLLAPWLFRRRRNVVLIVSTLAASVLAIASARLFGHYLAPGLLAHFPQPALLTYKLPLFLFGMATAACGLGRVGRAAFYGTAVIVLLSNGALTDLTAVAIAALLLFAADEEGGFPGAAMRSLRRLLSSPPARWGADVSYSLYLTHILIMPFTTAAIIRVLPGTGKMAIAGIAFAVFLAAVLALSHVLFITVERPCIRAGKRLLEGRHAALAAPAS